MNKNFFALVLSLAVLPVAAAAQTNTVAAPALSDQQRQMLHLTFERFGQQEQQLHQQLRSQVLAALTPVHRRELATLIGQLAIAPNPDLQAAATQIDRALLSSERGRILSAHQSFETQSRQLHEQMRAEMQREFPNMPDHPPMGNGMPQHPQLNAGAIVLMSLVPHPHMDWHGGPGMMMMHH